MTTNSSIVTVFFTDYQIAGAIIFLIAMVGLVANSMVVFWISQFPSMQNAFGKLSMNQCLADLLHGVVFAFYFAPTVFFDLEMLKDPKVSRWFGHLQLIFYDACNASHLMVSINRVFAIFFPIQYYKVFTVSVANWLNVLVWSSAIIPSYFAYVYADCYLYYNDTFTWTYAFTETKDCLISGWYYDFLKSLLTISVIVVMDVCTFAKCRIQGKNMLKNVTDAAVKNRRKDEARFVKQACLQASAFTIELITFFILSPYFTNRFVVFALTTMAWVFVHSLDGVIAVSCNKELSHRVWKYMGGSRVSAMSLNRESGKQQSLATSDKYKGIAANNETA